MLERITASLRHSKVGIISTKLHRAKTNSSSDSFEQINWARLWLMRALQNIMLDRSARKSLEIQFFHFKTTQVQIKWLKMMHQKLKKSRWQTAICLKNCNQIQSKKSENTPLSFKHCFQTIFSMSKRFVCL